MKKILFLLCVLSTLGLGAQNYVVLSPVSDTTDPWFEPVEIIADYRSAQVIVYDPSNINAVLPFLFTAQPRYVAVVIRPIDLHINFVRQFLMLSTQIDSDAFSDFSYGYITGATAQDAVDFLNRIIAAENAGIENYPFKIGGCVASSLNFVYTVANDYKTYLNPVSYAEIYMETNDSATGRDYFVANQNLMLANKLLDIGHNGDPHMIWLFEGGNMTPDPPVWLYDSTKIEDPAYARAGLSSYEFAGLNLYPAVAFNGACHSGETKKVMVEGDIAATFGDTEWYTRFYTMSDTFSFALTILKTGITGYFAPCGANNANDQGEDVYNTFLYNEPLGDIHKRSNDGVVMGFLGNRPVLELYTEGDFGSGCDVGISGTFDPDDWSGACYMLGGKANRIYFGDPLFNPFEPNHSDSLNITKASIDSVNNTTLDVLVDYHKPDVYTAYFPCWDKFHHGETRIYIPVTLPDYCGTVNSVYVIDSSGPYDLAFHALEQFDGKQILHLEVDIPDDMYDEIIYDITFRVNYQASGTAEWQGDDPGFSLYPNPAADYVVLDAGTDDLKELSWMISDVTGRIVAGPEPLTMKHQRIDIRTLKNGLYWIRLNDGGSAKRVVMLDVVR